MYHINHIKQLIKWILLTLSLTSLISCVSQPSQPPPIDSEVDTRPLQTDQNSPIHQKDKPPSMLSVEKPVDENVEEPVAESVEKPVDELVDKEYYGSLDTNVLLAKAETLFKNQGYEKALILFKLAAKRPDAQLVRSYAGLYQSHLKLKQQAAAEKAFALLLESSVQENNKLNFKFLFSLNSNEFIDDAELKKEYSFWLRQIASYFENNQLCTQIVGHSTKTEKKKKQALSLLRAEKVQTLISTHFPAIMQKSKVVGKGSSDNLMGTNTNDVIDTIDRRVEIIVLDCSDF